MSIQQSTELMKWSLTEREREAYCTVRMISMGSIVYLHTYFCVSVTLRCCLSALVAGFHAYSLTCGSHNILICCLHTKLYKAVAQEVLQHIVHCFVSTACQERLFKMICLSFPDSRDRQEACDERKA